MGVFDEVQDLEIHVSNSKTSEISGDQVSKSGCMEGERFHNFYRFLNDYDASLVSILRNDVDGNNRYRVMIIRLDPYSIAHLDPGR